MKGVIPKALILLLTGITIGCQKDLPKPETKPKIVIMEPTYKNQFEILPVYNQNSKEIPSLIVNHKTRGSQVMVECIVTGISFRESDRTKDKVGKMVIWIDGKRTSEASSAAFIIKGLSPGSHKLKLEVVKLNYEPYGLAKEFMVNIPK
ncbi:hypothetical protein QNH39_09060 [Neobacillus novalis]|uniref:Uncharacterized protein n=1 Tax=Neobacillus novalis TaxID=220687 RepID=A0AA95MV76_9BACI|nr:hypothetical protein [Neobacillus novalis]WHY87966.1 hypothetical protein QNH39_09060 [Neobacillus novalis]